MLLNSFHILIRPSVLSQSPTLIRKSTLARPYILSASARFSTSISSKMVAPAGLMSNRYKVEDMPDLTGKVAIVVGGSRGIGEATSTALAQKGCEVHILSATKEHADEAVENIGKLVPNASSLVHTHQLDLGTLSEVISTSKSLASSLPRLDILFLIAGIGVGPFGLTNDGLGNHFAVNHLSQVVIVDQLLPLLKETAAKKAQSDNDVEKFSTRIVNESSELHRASPSDVKCDDIEEFNHEMDSTKLYGRSKMLSILFMRELAKHHLPPLTSSTPILAASVHPGTVATEQQQGATEAYGILGKALEYAAPVLFMSKEQGSESALWAGTGPSAVERREEFQGRYFSEADGKIDTESSQAQDDVLAKKLWDLSVKTLREKVNYTVSM